MAYQVFWKIQFKSLRAGTSYTVSIYKDAALPSGYPLTLLGSVNPFVTDEEDSDDMFIPIRTQTGYLRIFDTGTAVNANGNEVTFNWRDIMPANDTDYPVILTHTEGNTTITDWVGFMQSQTFGGILYGNPQEREYPVQCPLSVIAGVDADTTECVMRPFAYLLKKIIDAIPAPCRPTGIVVQGGTDAQSWLLKLLDWQNLLDADEDALKARFSYQECLEDMCKFWGWTARMKGTVLYLTCVDDDAVADALILTPAQLSSLAAGTAAGTTDTMYSDVSLSGDIFESDGNEDEMVAGADKVVVKSDNNRIDSPFLKFAPSGVSKYMRSLQPSSAVVEGKTIYYYGNLTSFPIEGAPSPLLIGSTVTERGEFSYISIADVVSGDAIRIYKSYSAYQTTTCVKLETVVSHSFSDGTTGRWSGYGGFQLHGNIYQLASRVSDYSERTGIGNKSMFMRFGVGATRETAKWFNGQSWQTTMVAFRVTVGNQDNLLRPRIDLSGASLYYTAIPVTGEVLVGKLFVEFCGSDDLAIIHNDRIFFITDFDVTFTKTGWTGIEKNKPVIERGNTENVKYKASNTSKSGKGYNIDLAFASDNNMDAGYGLVYHPNGTAMQLAGYGEASEHPEQHLANRVAAYWSQRRRKITSTLNSYAVQHSGASGRVGDITPRNKVTMDGTTLHPVSINRDWWNDTANLTLMEI